MWAATDGGSQLAEGYSSVEVFISRETARQVIRYQLIHCRTLAGRLQKECAAFLGVTQPHYAQFEIEEGPKQRRVDQDQLDALLSYWGFGDRFPILSKVLEIARSSTPGGKHTVGMISDLDMYLALEFFAESIEAYDPVLIDGLLQTREYSRALVDYAMRWNPRIDPIAALDQRMSRQQLLRRTPTPLKLTVFLEERALSGAVVEDHEINAEIMDGQLRHILAEDDRLENLTIRVLRDQFRLRPTGNKPLSVVLLTNRWKLGYAPSSVSAHYLDAPAVVEECATIMRRLDKQALRPEESRQLITELIAA